MGLLFDVSSGLKENTNSDLPSSSFAIFVELSGVVGEESFFLFLIVIEANCEFIEEQIGCCCPVRVAVMCC